jgi:hypothetical protein
MLIGNLCKFKILKSPILANIAVPNSVCKYLCRRSMQCTDIRSSDNTGRLVVFRTTLSDLNVNNRKRRIITQRHTTRKIVYIILHQYSNILIFNSLIVHL